MNPLLHTHQATLLRNLHSPIKRVIKALVTGLMLLATITLAQAEGGKIVKWVDDKGVTHYGDKLPAEAAGRSNSEINKTGLVVKKNKAYDAKTDSVEVESVASEQSRKDSALLASYSSIEEIDLARDRNIKSDELAISILNQRIADASVQLKLNQDRANDAISHKRNVPNHVSDNIKQYQTQINKTQAEIAKIESNIAMTKARFATYKVRYAELKPNNEHSPVVLQRKKELADLDVQKQTVQTRLDALLKQAREAKKAGKEQSQEVSDGIQKANDEIARINTLIIAIQAKLNEAK